VRVVVLNCWCYHVSIFNKTRRYYEKSQETELNNKVDLSAVNKTNTNTKKLSLKKLAMRQKGPLRDAEGKFAATTGGGGLHSLRKMN
jgi:hypothetical protein